MIMEQSICHRHLDDELESVLIVDAALSPPLPGVLLIHEFTGLNRTTLDHGVRLARAGYAVLACDMYGPARRPTDTAQASRISHLFRDDRMLMRLRTRHCLDVLARQPETDEERLAALGMSFGGCAALELARSGAHIRGAVSMYGYLNTSHPGRAGKMNARILALHGDQDKVVGLTEIPAFEAEMAAAGADWKLVRYASAGHGFANPTLSPDPATGSAYCPVTADKAWSETLKFLAEVLGG